MVLYARENFVHLLKHDYEQLPKKYHNLHLPKYILIINVLSIIFAQIQT